MWAGRCRRGMTAAMVLALAARPSRAGGPPASRPATTPPAHVLRIVFFHSLTCNECRKVKRMLGRIPKPWGGRVRVEWKSTGDIQVFRELLLYDEHYCYGVRTTSPPVMFVGRRHLEGEKRIYRDLARVVREELAAGAVTYRPPAGPATKGGGDVPEEIVGRFRGFRIAALAAAGLLDGVNPCAFTTIVFLLSMLAQVGKTRRQLAVAGVGFTAAVFVTGNEATGGCVSRSTSCQRSHVEDAVLLGRHFGTAGLVQQRVTLPRCEHSLRPSGALFIKLALPGACAPGQTLPAPSGRREERHPERPRSEPGPRRR